MLPTWNDRMHETLERLGHAPLYKRLLALVFFFALLIGFRQLALLSVTFIVMARGLGFLGGQLADMTKQTERRGVIMVLFLLAALLFAGVWAAVHAGGRFYSQLQALREGRPLTELVTEL